MTFIITVSSNSIKEGALVFEKVKDLQYPYIWSA